MRGELLLDAYRERTAQQGRNLSAFGVPAVVANIPLTEGDAVVRVQLPKRDDENVPREASLGHALRRRGRVVLVGEGGSGKSTALRVLAAELAAGPASNPLPLCAHWQDILEQGDDPLRAAISNAASHLSPEDAGLLDAAMHRAFARGTTALLLDGLDEVTTGRERLATKVKTWLDTAPTATEVVVATRPSALPSAAALDWPRLRLAEPRDSHSTARAIVAAVGADRGLEHAWVRERTAWIQARLDRDAELSATPLMVVLLATLAATADDPEDLPLTRPAVLWRVSQEVMTRWEVGTRHRGRVVVGHLGPTEAQGALQRALFVLARVSVLANVADHGTALADDLVAQFGEMPPARLAACVNDATRFWMSTGIFALAGEQLRAHPRPLAEAALARQAVDERAPVEEVLVYRADAAGWDVLAMIASERDDVRSAWVDLVIAGGNADELIALINAHLDGATLKYDEIAGLCGAPAVKQAIAADREPDRIVEALLALDPAPAVTETLRGAVAAVLRFDEHPALEAALMLRSEALTDGEIDRLRAFFVAERPESGVGEDGVHRIDTLDNLSLTVLQDVALWLLAHSRADAELVADRLEHLKTRRFRRRLPQAFAAAGHADLAARARTAPLDYALDSSRFGNFDKAVQIELGLAAAMHAPRPLSWAERRRLDELADLRASMESEWWNPAWVERRAKVLERFQRVAVVLGGFDAAAVAAEARQVLDALDGDPDADDVLTDAPTARPLTRWELVEDAERTVDEIVEIYGLVPRQCVHPLSTALARAPCRGHAFDAVVVAQPTLRGYWSLAAARVAFALAADIVELAGAWSASEDVRRRQASAFAVGYMLHTRAEAAEPLALALLSDSDRGVQVEVVERLAKAVEHGAVVGPEVVYGLERLEGASPKPYECLWCAASVPEGRQACPSCQSSSPTYHESLDQALGRARPSPPGDDSWKQFRELTPGRRVRSRSPLR